MSTRQGRSLRARQILATVSLPTRAARPSFVSTKPPSRRRARCARCPRQSRRSPPERSRACVPAPARSTRPPQHHPLRTWLSTGAPCPGLSTTHARSPRSVHHPRPTTTRRPTPHNDAATTSNEPCAPTRPAPRKTPAKEQQSPPAHPHPNRPRYFSDGPLGDGGRRLRVHLLNLQPPCWARRNYGSR